ncbi:unnamed protein product [Rotaria sordida]|uniref:Uncharacterized protein n=1 Tax=Rotaria sordida TaxID=392033 RepID=A0A815TL59_9BILA|nr:unnamed protein product [Rotaria sordida]CAF1507938.1 unnamed protein product [Rotaria sordida]
MESSYSVDPYFTNGFSIRPSQIAHKDNNVAYANIASDAVTEINRNENRRRMAYPRDCLICTCILCLGLLAAAIGVALGLTLSGKVTTTTTTETTETTTTATTATTTTTTTETTTTTTTTETTTTTTITTTTTTTTETTTTTTTETTATTTTATTTTEYTWGYKTANVLILVVLKTPPSISVIVRHTNKNETNQSEKK